MTFVTANILCYKFEQKMAQYECFLEMELWRRSRTYASKIWDLTLTGTFAKDFGLKDQIRCSSGSIMDNIAEGRERDGNKEYRQFLSIAKGSAAESISQLHRAYDRKHIMQPDFEQLKQEGLEIARMLGGLIRYVKSQKKPGHKFT
jgi:four helix bundle protein